MGNYLVTGFVTKSNKGINKTGFRIHQRKASYERGSRYGVGQYLRGNLEVRL